MKCLYVFFALLIAFTAGAVERSFSIVFGNKQISTNTLTNTTFINSVEQGASYIDHVTSVVAVFPDQPDCIRLSSNSTNGKFNIHIAEAAQVVAKRIVLLAARYNNTRDDDASLMLNSETLYIESISPEQYTLSIPSRPERTLTNIIIDADHRVYLYSITVYYDDTQGTVDPEMPVVAAPVISPAGGSITAGSTVAISCPTPRSVIYYTIDGADPTSASTVYAEPFAVHNSLTVKAFAVADNMTPSPITEAFFNVRNPEASLQATFNFARPESLSPAISTPEEKDFVLLDGRTFTDGDAAISFAAGSDGNTHARLFHSYDAGCDVRIYAGDELVVKSLNPNYCISSIDFEVSESANSIISLEPSSGTFDDLSYTWSSASDSPVAEVTLTAVFQSRLKSMTVNLDSLQGIADLTIDHDTRAAWYTIDGRRVPANIAAPGFYIQVTPEGTRKVVTH